MPYIPLDENPPIDSLFYDRLAGILKNNSYLPSPNRYAALNPKV
jgi:hypothetical protein